MPSERPDGHFSVDCTCSDCEETTAELTAEKLFPGSREAVAQGCTCSVLAAVYAYEADPENPPYIIESKCLLHGLRGATNADTD